MLLPPLPVFLTEGLAAYPQAPEVNNKTNRDDLTGERMDRIIWVAEKTQTRAVYANEQPGNTYLGMLTMPLMVLVLIFLYLRVARNETGQAPGQQVLGEKAAFKKLQTACRSNNTGQTHSALHAGLDCSSVIRSATSRAVTLIEFAQTHRAPLNP